MRIGIDIDNTLADTFQAFRPYILEHDKKVLRNKGIIHPKKADFSKFDWTKDEVAEFFKLYQDVANEAFTKLSVKKDAVAILKKLKKEGHSIIIITAREEPNIQNTYQVSEQWLKESGIVFDQLFVGATKKGEICEREKIDVMIDDSYGQCSFIAEHNHLPVLIFDEEKQYSEEKGLISVANWLEVDFEIQKLCSRKWE